MLARLREKNATRKAPPRQRGTPKPRRSFARWRALSLSLVYVVFAIHILHWKLTGKTLAPLELNEVMYTLELGIITAGFLFMCALVLGTLIFGRFFCSWACHIMVLQDACAWLLRRLGIRRKPIRSRLLLLVPPLTAFYMFVWPQIVRTWHSRALPTFHFATDRDGWASLVTDNFWRNLPSAGVIVFTFVVCGFAIVYLLGSRTFCTYVCPYGAVFALADRFAPGRIRVSDKCKQCGTCTAACTSGIRVHEEVKQHGMIVNPACLKDLDCVAACPQQALSYTFTKPSLFRSVSSGGRFGSLKYDFSLGEELIIGVVFLVVLLSFRGLYSRVPFLLSLALGGIIAYLTISALRMRSRPNVTVASVRVKHAGRLTIAGRAFVGCVPLLTALVGHSAFVRYHEFLGLTQARAGGSDADTWSHLRTADAWGLMANERVELSLMVLAGERGSPRELDDYARRVIERHPRDLAMRLRYADALDKQDRSTEAERVVGGVIRDAVSVPQSDAFANAHALMGGLLARRGAFAEAADELRTAIDADPHRPGVRAELGSLLAELGRLDEAVAELEESIRLDPDDAKARYNLGTILAHLGRFAEAVPHYETALTITPDDAALCNNFGFALLRVDRFEEARAQFETAIAIDPRSADAHFNLGRLLANANLTVEASRHFQHAVALDQKYARLLEPVAHE